MPGTVNTVPCINVENKRFAGHLWSSEGVDIGYTTVLVVWESKSKSFTRLLGYGCCCGENRRVT